MTPLHQLNLRRKTSTLNRSGLTSVASSSASRPATPRPADPLTPRSGHRHTSGSLRTLFDRFRNQQPQFEMITPPSSSNATKLAPPQLSKSAKAFADSLNAQELSNFLTWMLYYDVVELPESPYTWYEKIHSMDMRGWIALGDFLSKTTKAGYGFDLVVLDSICDRIKLPRFIVNELLIQFAEPEKMRHTTIATVVTKAKLEGNSELRILEAVQAKLHLLHKLAANLKPLEGSIYDVWHAVVQKRLRGFLHLVVGPRIAHLLSGKPMIIAAMSDRLQKDVKDGIKLNYMYEAMQQERKVPLNRYGVYANTTDSGISTPPSSPPDVLSDLGEAELARSHAIRLMKENHELYAQISKLTRENESLVEANEKLAQKAGTLGALQSTDYFQSNANVDRPTTAPSRSSTSDDEQGSSDFLQVPRAHARPRSISAGAVPALTSQLNQQLTVSAHSHHRRKSEVLLGKYEDVFSRLADKPLPSVRLSDPVTGSPIEPTTALPVLPRQPSRPVSHTPIYNRRSGMIFDARAMSLLAEVGASTPETIMQDEDAETIAEAPTPTPLARQRYLPE